MTGKGKALKNRLIKDKDSLIQIFEELFGCNKAPLYEAKLSSAETRSGLHLALTDKHSKSGQNLGAISEANYASVGNPLKIIKDY